MEQLLEKEGAIEFFLMCASQKVNWEGSTTDIQGDKVKTIAAEVTSQFGIELTLYDINLTWAKLRALWETWVQATYYVRLDLVNATTGIIDIDDFAWDQLVRVSHIFFYVHATFSSFSVSFLDMFVTSLFFFLFFFFSSFALFSCSCLVENKYKTHV